MCVVRERTWVFGGVPAEPLLRLRLSIDLCACFGVGLGETRRAAWLIAAAYSAGNQGRWFGMLLSVLVF